MKRACHCPEHHMRLQSRMTDQRVHVHVHGALARRVAERGVPRCGTRRVCCWVPRLCQLRGPGGNLGVCSQCVWLTRSYHVRTVVGMCLCRMRRLTRAKRQAPPLATVIEMIVECVSDTHTHTHT